MQDHEEGGAVLPGQAEQVRVQSGRQPEGDLRAPVAELGRPRPVDRQFQARRQPGQPAAPVGDLAADPALRVLLAAEHRALPQRVVGVLDRERREVRCPLGQARRVGGAEVVGQRVHRPAVTGDVVQHHEQHVIGGCQPEERRAQREFGAEVVAAPGLGDQ